VKRVESGLSLLERSGAALLSARARLYLAAMLRERGSDGDVARATALEKMSRPDVPRLALLAHRAGSGSDS
jgi:hypothetical protein